jgi:Flp pilus assembly protein TadB
MTRIILGLVVVLPVILFAITVLVDEMQDPLAGFHDEFRAELVNAYAQGSTDGRFAVGELPESRIAVAMRESNSITSNLVPTSESKGSNISQRAQALASRSRFVYSLLGFLALVLLLSGAGAIPTLATLIAIPVYHRWYSEGSRRKREAVRKSIELEFPAFVELFSILVTAGESPSLALLRLSEITEGELALFMKASAADLQNGRGFARVLDELASAINSPIVRRFCDSLIVATERGSALSEVLHRQVEDVRKFHQSELIRQSGRAEIALMIPVVFLILPISVLFALWPSYMALGIATG